MKLEEAIVLLTIWHDDPHQFHNPDYPEAVKLGAEALEAILEWRSHLGSVGCLPLPSETGTYCKFCGLAHPGIECPDRQREK